MTTTFILCTLLITTSVLAYKFGEIDGIKKLNKAKDEQILAMKKQIYLLKVKTL